jgi:hypothetical protein
MTQESSFLRMVVAPSATGCSQNWPPQPDRCGGQVLRGKLPGDEEAFAMASFDMHIPDHRPLWELGSVGCYGPRDPADDRAFTNSAFLRAFRLMWVGDLGYCEDG